MTSAHKGQILALKNKVVPVDENTTALFHYDLNANCVLHGTEPIGSKRSLRFNTSEVVLSNDIIFDGLNQLTIAAWIYPTSYINRGTILTRNGSFYFQLHTNGKIQSFQYGTSPEGYHESVDTVPLNTWTHVAYSYNGQTLSFYINGQLSGSVPKTGSIVDVNVSYPPAIGNEIGGASGRYFSGSICDVNLWRVGLSGDQIKAIMNNRIIGNEEELIGYWKLDETDGLIVRDSSLYCNYGTASQNIQYDYGPSVYNLTDDGYYGKGVLIEEETTNLVVLNTGNGISNLKVGDSVTVSGNKLFTRLTEDTYMVKYIADAQGASITHVTNVIQWGQETSIRTILSAEILDYYEAPGTNAPFGLGRSSFGSPALNGRNGLGYKWHEYQGVDEGSGNLQIAIRSERAASVVTAGSYMVWRNLQAERKRHPTSYVPNVRPTGRLRYPADMINPVRGTISFWYKSLKPTASIIDQHSSPKIIQVGGYFQHSSFVIWNYINSLRLYIKGVSGESWSAVANVPFNIEYNTWCHITVTWEHVNWKVYVNGVLLSTLTSNFPLGSISDNILWVGGDATSSAVMHGVIDELRIDKIARSDSEISSWYYSNSAFYPKGIYKNAY